MSKLINEKLEHLKAKAHSQGHQKNQEDARYWTRYGPTALCGNFGYATYDPCYTFSCKHHRIQTRVQFKFLNFKL